MIKHKANINKILFTSTGNAKRSPDDFKRIEKYLVGLGLEIGCGENRVSDTIMTCDYQTTTNADMICDCSKEIPIRSKTFDFVVSFHCIKDMSDPLSALIEWRRILKSEGKLILVLPDMSRHCKKEEDAIWGKWAKWFCSPEYTVDLINQVKEFSIIKNEPLGDDTVSYLIYAERLFCEADSHQWAYTPVGLHLVLGTNKKNGKAFVLVDDGVTEIDKREIKIIGQNRNIDLYNVIKGKPVRYGGTIYKTIQEFHKEIING